MRFRRSEANCRRVAGVAAHSPLSWASERATMCSMSVLPGAFEPGAGVGAVDAAPLRHYFGLH